MAKASVSKAAKAASKSTNGKTSDRVADAMQRIRVSHYHDGKIYAGTKADVVTAGLAKAEHCPTEQGEPYAIKYKLDYAEASCSLHDSEKVEYLVCINDPQPRTCKLILKTLGDPTALDEILKANLSSFYAIQDFAGVYEELPTSVWTNREFLEHMIDGMMSDVAKAQKLFRDNAKFQTHIKQATTALSRLYKVMDSIEEETDSENIAALLRVYVANFGDNVEAAAVATQMRSVGDWGTAERALERV